MLFCELFINITHKLNRIDSRFYFIIAHKITKLIVSLFQSINNHTISKFLYMKQREKDFRMKKSELY